MNQGGVETQQNDALRYKKLKIPKLKNRQKSCEEEIKEMIESQSVKNDHEEQKISQQQQLSIIQESSMMNNNVNAIILQQQDLSQFLKNLNEMDREQNQQIINSNINNDNNNNRNGDSSPIMLPLREIENNFISGFNSILQQNQNHNNSNLNDNNNYLNFNPPFMNNNIMQDHESEVDQIEVPRELNNPPSLQDLNRVEDQEQQQQQAQPLSLQSNNYNVVNINVQNWLNNINNNGVISPKNQQKKNGCKLSLLKFERIQDCMDSNDTSPRSIPEEHDLSISYEDHYLDNYMCLLKGITWGRESHGLFDYGTRHPLKKQMKCEIEQTLVRTQNNDLYLLNIDTDLTKIFDKQAQPLINIRKQKNKYYLEALKVPKKDDLIPHVQSEPPNQQPPGAGQQAQNNANANNANAAAAQDDQQLPCDTRERMYLIVRSMQKDDKKIPYKIKKHDIIKLGRVLFKVLDMRIDELDQQREFKRWKEKRRQINHNKNLQQKAQQQQQQKYQQQQQHLDNINNIYSQPSNANVGYNYTNQDGDYSQHNNIHQDYEININNNMIPQKSPSLVSINEEDVNLESCRECLEGEVNYQLIDCLLPEPSIQIHFKAEPNHALMKATSALPQCRNNTAKNNNKYFNHSNNNLCLAQKQSVDVPLNRGGRIIIDNNNNIINGIKSDINIINAIAGGNMDNSKNIDQAYPSSQHSSIRNLRRPRSSGRQVNAREDGELINFINKSPKNMREDQKEEESLEKLQQNEQAITKMDPNDVLHDLNSDANAQAQLDKEMPLCRFCWGSDVTLANPLLSSCKCKGGIRYIHYDCLKEWLNTKRTVKEQPTITSYYYKSFECELCKTPYPLVFKTKQQNKRYSLIDPSRMTGDYMVVESLTLESNLQRIVHVIHPTTIVKMINLGRGHDSDLRVNDISVSRCHAMIKLKKDGFYLKDNKSKFGTLVMIKHRLSLTPAMTKAVQVGRTVINFCIKKSLPYDYKEGEFMRINARNRDENLGQGGNYLDQQKAKLLKHLENMQQAEDYIQKQASEHQRLANGDNFHQRRYFVQQNIHEEEIKIDYDLRYPQIIQQNIIQVQNNIPSSEIRQQLQAAQVAIDSVMNINNQNASGVNGVNNNNNNIIQIQQQQQQQQQQPSSQQNNVMNNIFAINSIQQNLPGQENLQHYDDDQRNAIQQIGSVVRDNEMFNVLRRSEANNGSGNQGGSIIRIQQQNSNNSNGGERVPNNSSQPQQNIQQLQIQIQSL